MSDSPLPPLLPAPCYLLCCFSVSAFEHSRSRARASYPSCVTVYSAPARVAVFSFSEWLSVFAPEPSASPARFWLDCCGLCPPVIKQIVFWILFLGLGCLFLFQKLHERKQRLAKAALATAASHSSPTPSASPVSPAAGQSAKPKPTAILPPPPALKPKPTPMLPKPTPMLPKPTPMLRPNPNGV